MQYTGALLITNKITPAKPTTISFVDDLRGLFSHFGQRSLLRLLGQSSEIEHNPKMNISFFDDLGELLCILVNIRCLVCSANHQKLNVIQKQTFHFLMT